MSVLIPAGSVPTLIVVTPVVPEAFRLMVTALFGTIVRDAGVTKRPNVVATGTPGAGPFPDDDAPPQEEIKRQQPATVTSIPILSDGTRRSFLNRR